MRVPGTLVAVGVVLAVGVGCLKDKDSAGGSLREDDFCGAVVRPSLYSSEIVFSGGPGGLYCYPSETLERARAVVMEMDRKRVLTCLESALRDSRRVAVAHYLLVNYSGRHGIPLPNSWRVSSSQWLGLGVDVVAGEGWRVRPGQDLLGLSQDWRRILAGKQRPSRPQIEE